MGDQAVVGHELKIVFQGGVIVSGAVDSPSKVIEKYSWDFTAC